MSTLKHGDLLAALAELPPMKLESFSVTLGVPKRIIDEARENYRGNVYRIKSDAMSWWLANAEIISWDAVARALESPGVDERNLAREIRRSRSGGIIRIINVLFLRHQELKTDAGGRHESIHRQPAIIFIW